MKRMKKRKETTNGNDNKRTRITNKIQKIIINKLRYFIIKFIMHVIKINFK